MRSTTTLESLLEARQPEGLGGRFHGVYAAVVTDIVDPDGQGRVRLRLPWSPDSDGRSYEAWARLATLMAGADRGTWLIPDPGDEVLVAFEAGDPRRPYVLGALWNGQDAPPESMDSAGRNEKKTLRSRNGIFITLEDADGRERLILETPGGQRITLADGPGRIDVEDSSGNTVTMQSSGITITSASKITLEASQVEVSAGMVKVNAGISDFSGLVQAPAVKSDAIIGTSYTPGAGNIW